MKWRSLELCLKRPPQ